MNHNFLPKCIKKNKTLLLHHSQDEAQCFGISLKENKINPQVI